MRVIGDDEAFAELEVSYQTHRARASLGHGGGAAGRSEPPGPARGTPTFQRQHRVQLDGIQKDLAATKTARDNEAKRANGLHHLQQNVLNMLLERLARVTVLRSVLSEVFDKAGYRLEFDTAEGQTWRYEAEASTGAATSDRRRHPSTGAATSTGAGPDAAAGITGPQHGTERR